MKLKTPKTQGTYYFTDGFVAWYFGLSGTEKMLLVREHGKIVRFVPGP